jgi:hypothetical protein
MFLPDPRTLKNCKPKRKNSLDLCACVCLKWYFPLRIYTHKLCNLELPTVCPLALSVNEFWDIYCPVCRFDGDGYDACDLFHSMSTHLQAHLNFVKPPSGLPFLIVTSNQLRPAILESLFAASNSDEI